MSTTKVAGRGKIFDALAELKDAGAITASAAGTVGGSAAVYDADSAELPLNACAVIDVSACEVDDTDELYHIAIEGSDVEDFSATLTELAVLEVGAVATYPGDIENTLGRYVVPFTNNKGGEVYKYIRVNCTIAGTVTPDGINYTCFLSKM